MYKKTYPSGSFDTFNFTWLPYYLDPDAPRKGTPLTERFLSKHGPERAQAFQQRLTDIGLAEGISFTFDSRIGNTRDAHRLVELARSGRPELQTAVVDRLYKVYFEASADITDRKMLCEVGVASGLDAKVVADWMESDQGGKEVNEQAKAAREGGGSGVPRYVIQDVYAVDGADDPSAFLEVFDQIKRKENGN